MRQAPRGKGRAKAPLVSAGGPMRVAKAIAHAGLCSRRDAEALIAAGRVAVNGRVLSTPAHLVAPGDNITFDGNLLPALRALELDVGHRSETNIAQSACQRAMDVTV